MTEPRRERITSPLTNARAHTPRSVRQEITETTGVGQVYIRTLVRSQFRAAITVLVTLVLSIGLLPLAFVALPALTTSSIGRFPLPWVILGAAAFPVLWTLGWLYVRHAERTEADFATLVETSGADGDSS